MHGWGLMAMDRTRYENAKKVGGSVLEMLDSICTLILKFKQY